MSHVFISYKREDEHLRNTLIEGLKKFNVPFWADLNINAGETWQEAIDEALENAFAVVVILTPKSMVSPYVVYEWSWALGHGIPIIPLLFEDVPYEITHSRLASLHYHDCRSGITDEVLQLISIHQTAPLTYQYAEIALNNLIRPLRLYLKVGAWLHKYSDNATVYPISSVYENTRLMVFLEYSDLINAQISNYFLSIGNRLSRNLRLKLEDLTKRLIALFHRFYSDEKTYEFNIAKFESEWVKFIEPLLKNVYGYDDLSQLEKELADIPIEPELIWDSQTRARIFLLANSPVLNLGAKNTGEKMKGIFNHLLSVTDPEFLDKPDKEE